MAFKGRSGGDFMLHRWSSHYANPTPAERALEPALHALSRTPVRFQHPLWGLAVFLDFALTELKVAIEVDGDEHFTSAGRRKDKLRTAKLLRAGWRTVRCTNDEALTDPVGTATRLLTEAGHLPPPKQP